MFQSDALSRRPDHIPEKDNDNEDITILPDSLFINLIDTELQQQIADSKTLDTNAAEALKPCCSTKDDNISLKMTIFDNK